MRPQHLNMAVVVVTFVVCALLGEATVRVLQHYDLLRYYGDQPARKGAEKMPTIKDYSARYIKSDNPKLFLEHDPTDPRLNKFGMRGRVPELSKATNVYRIAVIGDSIAFGYGLPDAESFPRQLERLLNQQNQNGGTSHNRKFEIINFAVSGYGLEAYTEVYGIKVRPFHPDMVILAYVLNDPFSNKMSYGAVGAGINKAAKLNRVGRVSQLAAWILDTSQQAYGNYQSTKLFKEMYFQPEYLRVIDDNLALLHNEAKLDAVKLVAFVFPYFHDMSDYPLENVHKVIDKSMQDAGIPFHDLREDYRTHDALALRLEPNDYTHPNAEGQRIAAEAMANFLKKQNLL